MIIVGLSLLLACFVALNFWRERNPKHKAALPEGSVQMPLDMLTRMLDDLEEARLHAGRLRRGMEALIHHWPGHFSPEELAAAQSIVNEAVGVGL